MRQIEVSEPVYDALRRLTTDFHQSPDAVLAALLNLPVPASPTAGGNPLIAFTLSPAFHGKFTDADRYLTLIGWFATQHPSEFQEYVSLQTDGRRYLARQREEIVTQGRHNQARRVPGTEVWAIMNLDTPTKRRVLNRLFAFGNYPEDVIETICATIGPRRLVRVAV